jgi:hypothetical protein
MNAILDLPEGHAQVLQLLIKKIPPIDLPWSLTGSAGLRLQGVDIPVNDLDLQTDAQTIYVIEQRLTGFIKTPVHVWESEHTLSHHGQAEINGLQVEFLGDMRHRSLSGVWEPAIDIASTRVWLNWRELQIPVLPLLYEALAYEKMGRTQKAELIHAALKKEIL